MATRYQLVLVTAEQARIDFENSVVEVFVVASDNPHGVVEFGQPFQILADEGVGVTNVPVLRNFGSVGTVMVNFTVITDTATAGVDYVIQEYCKWKGLGYSTYCILSRCGVSVGVTCSSCMYV